MTETTPLGRSFIEYFPHLFLIAGTYTCVAQNSLDTVTESGLVQVVGVPPRLEGPGPQDEKLAGERLELPCRLVAGNPAPTPKWYKDGHDVDLSRVEVGSSGALVVAGLQLSDAGKYVCRAVNSQGSHSVEAKVHVRNRTVIHSAGRSVRLDNVVIGTDLELPCQVMDVQTLLVNTRIPVCWAV